MIKFTSLSNDFGGSSVLNSDILRLLQLHFPTTVEQAKEQCNSLV